MGLSSFPSPGEGVLPLLVMNTVMSMAIVKNTLRSVFQVVGGGGSAEEGENGGDDSGGAMDRRVSITRYSSLRRRRCRCSDDGEDCPVECCVCLCGFEADEEVSELSCKHFFHKGCLDKWLDKQHTTCPLCRSIL